MSHKNVIDLAVQVLEPNAQQYNPKQYACYIAITKSEDDDIYEDFDPELYVDEVEDDDEEEYSSEIYCSDCIKEKVQVVKKNNPDKHVTYESTNACLGERTGFECCSSCGKYFDFTLIVDSDELDYWEEKPQLEIQKPYIAWQLSELLNGYVIEDRDQVETMERLKKLALRVLNLQEFDHFNFFDS